jgi:serine/threonine protein kinase
VSLVEMATARLPYRTAAAAIYSVVVIKRYPSFPEDLALSAAAHAFLARCLVADPSARAGCAELLEHPFVATGGRDAATSSSSSVRGPAAAAAAAAEGHEHLAAALHQAGARHTLSTVSLRLSEIDLAASVSMSMSGPPSTARPWAGDGDEGKGGEDFYRRGDDEDVDGGKEGDGGGRWGRWGGVGGDGYTGSTGDFYTGLSSSPLVSPRAHRK